MEPYPERPTEMTEQAILGFFWDYWKSKMDAKFGLGYDKTTKENCIEDWVVDNFAWEKL